MRSLVVPGSRSRVGGERHAGRGEHLRCKDARSDRDTRRRFLRNLSAHLRYPSRSRTGRQTGESARRKVRNPRQPDLQVHPSKGRPVPQRGRIQGRRRQIYLRAREDAEGGLHQAVCRKHRPDRGRRRLYGRLQTEGALHAFSDGADAYGRQHRQQESRRGRRRRLRNESRRNGAVRLQKLGERQSDNAGAERELLGKETRLQDARDAVDTGSDEPDHRTRKRRDRYRVPDHGERRQAGPGTPETESFAGIRLLHNIYGVQLHEAALRQPEGPQGGQHDHRYRRHA